MPEHVRTTCCDLHSRRCEPPNELCCQDCTEHDHPKHAHSACVLPLSDIEREVLDTFAKAMGWTKPTTEGGHP